MSAYRFSKYLVRRLIFAGITGPSNRIDGAPLARNPAHEADTGGSIALPSALKAVEHLGHYLGRLTPPVSVLGSESSWCVLHATFSRWSDSSTDEMCRSRWLLSLRVAASGRWCEMVAIAAGRRSAG